MKIFGSLLIAVIVVSSSNAQEGLNRLLSRDVVVSEVEARDLSPIEIADLETPAMVTAPCRNTIS